MVLGFFMAVDERLEEVCFRDRQRLRPGAHLLYVFLKRFSFLEDVLDGAVELCLGLCSLLALLKEAPRLFLSFACLGEGLTAS